MNIVPVMSHVQAEFGGPIATDIPFSRLERNVNAYIRTKPDDAQGFYVLGRLHSLAYAAGSNLIGGVITSRGDTLPAEVRSDEQAPPFLPETEKQWRSRVQRFLTEPYVMTDVNVQSEVDDLLSMPDDVFARQQRQGTAIPSKKVLGALRRGLDARRYAGARKSRALQVVAWLDRYETGATHLQRAIEAYSAAIQRRPDFGFAQLGLAWTMLQAGRVEDAALTYHQAFKASASHGLAKPLTAQGRLAFFWHGCVALEAGESLIKLASQLPHRWQSLDLNELWRIVSDLKTRVARTTSITPILIPLGDATRLEDLLSDKRVEFDLLGDRAPRSWPWVRSGAGFLVWFPDRSSLILSGHQLFGNVTWQVFWSDGYAPLQLLDDDADGWLRGSELVGLGVWRDINENGMAEASEVLSVEVLGIEAIHCQAESSTSGQFCRTGVRMKGGATRPTFDWIVSPPPPAHPLDAE